MKNHALWAWNENQPSISMAQKAFLNSVGISGYCRPCWMHDQLDRKWEWINWSKGCEKLVKRALRWRRTLGGGEKKCLRGCGYLKGFLNLWWWLKGNLKAAGTTFLRTNAASSVICKSVGLLYKTGPNWTRGWSWAKWDMGWITEERSQSPLAPPSFAARTGSMWQKQQRVLANQF